MKEILQNVMDEILIRSIDLKHNAGQLCPQLQSLNCLSRDEVDLIACNKTETQKIMRLFTLLKCKSDDVIVTLQRVCHSQSEFELFNEIQTTLKEFLQSDLIWQPLIERNLIPISNRVKFLKKTLQEYYEKDLQPFENYWKLFGVGDLFGADTFYNKNIVMKDRFKQFTKTVTNFDDLFSTDHKQFIIVAGPGYGKSTLVHQMTRQWVSGEKAWTQKFVFLFLCRLSDVAQNGMQSMQSYLSTFFSPKNATEVEQLLGDANLLEKCLFIFDGVDELQNELCKEIENILYCKGAKLAHVVVTSRPCDELEELGGGNLYIELNGFTNQGVDEYLRKFQQNPEKIQNDVRNILKVPLFATMFCLMHKDAVVGSRLNVSGAVEKFVNFACNRYTIINPNFTEMEKNVLLLTLGQAGQNKFSFMKKINTVHPTITKELLSNAIKTGLVYQKSTLEEFIFAHQTIAEYCTAYYWTKTSSLKIKHVSGIYVTFAEPFEAAVQHSDLFSCFISRLNPEYKTYLWNNFELNAPYLDDYESLPKRAIKGNNHIALQFVPVPYQCVALSKFEFFTTNDFVRDTLWVSGAYFESEYIFECMAKVKKLVLHHCSFNISAESFFRLYDMQTLTLSSCKFNYCNMSIEDGNFDLNLKTLEIKNCDCTVTNYLNYVMSRSTKLKTIVLANTDMNKVNNRLVTTFFMENNCNEEVHDGNDWITALDNNKMLHISIQHFSLICRDPIDLTQLFETFEKIITLQHLTLEIDRSCTKLEQNALAISFKTTLKHLKCGIIRLKDEYGKEIRVTNRNVQDVFSRVCQLLRHVP